MASRKRKTSRKPPRSRPARGAKPGRMQALGRKTRRPWLKWSFLILLFATMAFGLYLLYLDRTVRTEFEARRWMAPARVYARPLELYAGVKIDAGRLVGELKRLGYRPVGYPREPGAYSRNRNRVLVRTRGFVFPDGREPARFLELKFSGAALSSLKDARGGKDLALVRLEAPQIGTVYPAGREDRVLVRRGDLPELLVQALITVEDRDFYHHKGIDPFAVARAAWANLRAGRVVQGGSTLTQQLAKNFYLSRERSLGRKLKEALMALLLEWRYDKDEILEAYCNAIFLGQDGRRAIHGFGLASQFYFGRPLAELDLPRIALLVGMLPGPSVYDPRRHPKRAKERRNLVLRVLAERGVIDQARARAASRAPLGVSRRSATTGGGYPAFMDLVRRQLHRDYREQDLVAKGLKVFTSLDPWLQERTEQALSRELGRLERGRRLAKQLQGAAVIVNRDDAEVLAVVGGRDPRYAGFNRALDAVRPIGSLIKPVVYLAALADSDGYTLVSLLDDSRLGVRGPDGTVWRPENYDRKVHGRVALHRALAHSYNLATVRLGMQTGVDRVAVLLRRLGVHRPVQPYPSLLLGAAALSPLEVTQIYQSLAAGGFYSPLRAIREVSDRHGRALQRYPLTLTQVVDRGPAYLLNRVLQEVVSEGTARELERLLPQGLNPAGKTGTTDDLRDSWFAGFSGDKVGVVWVGRDDNQPAGLTGAAGAMRVWGAVFSGIHPQPLELPAPDSVEFLWVDPKRGWRSAPDCPGARKMPFIRGSAPQRTSRCGGERG